MSGAAGSAVRIAPSIKGSVKRREEYRHRPSESPDTARDDAAADVDSPEETTGETRLLLSAAAVSGSPIGVWRGSNVVLST